MKKRSFRSTFVSVILVITVAISIVNLAVYGINIKKIRQVEVLKMKTAGERIDDMITISLNNIKGLKQICCTDNYARNILLKNNEKNDIGTKFENQNYMDNALKHIASMDTLILRATIVNKYGNIYCTDTSIPEEYVKTIRNMTKEWMLFEGKEDEYYYGGLQGDNANILTFLYPLHTYGNTPIALLAVDINYKTFQSILENAFYENSGECFILTGEQELFHIGEDLYQKEEKGYIFDKSQKMMKENLIVDTFQSKGKNFYISSRQNMLSGWKIIQVIPEERLFEEVDQKIKWNSIFLLGALMLVVSFSIYYTKKIIEPLEEFCKKISHTKGDQLQIINLEHMKLTREIANVIENYNEMANKMNEYLVREIIYDKNQRKIQSKMLRYQINPHFLYNTLNLIASMGELSDFPEIVEITKNLSCIMQYNVKGSRFVSLKTEVEMVKAYLEIQRIRFHDCFSVEYEIERQIEQVRIVKFILQPIVENIFEHGFTMDENDNKIWIKAFKCENDIVILVKDNGCGIDSEKREELNRILCERTRRISYIDEEYIRSCQFGFFNSLSRCHGKTPREPWNFGEKAEKIFKKFNDIRHLLLPYLYSTTYKTHLSDIPVIRPVVMEYPEDRSARNVELEYFLGDSLLVVPVFDQEDEIDVYLPNGQWIDLFTHERIKGGRWVKRKIELDKIPVFIRQNKMIPMLTKIPENIEEKYENLDVILFCEDEIRDTYIDDGNVQNLKAKIEEGTLFINTDMDASYFTVYAEKCLDNAVVNGQNWEIKKEKEGYYKIALEK